VRKKKKIKFLFLLLKYATIKFLITHKFCSFCSSCGLRETSIGVDYTERRKTERKKEKCMFPITCGPPQREELLRKILGGGFLNFIKQNYTERRKTERKKEFKLTLDHRAHHREKKY